MSNSLNLQLPLLEEAQAQKHVTVNDALSMLDLIVQLTVIDRIQTTPPVSVSEGDRYIVAVGATDAWAGHDTDVAAYIDGAWIFFAPRGGWIAFDQSTGGIATYDGAAWGELSVSLTANTTDKLGINTSADETNRLSVRSDYALFAPDPTGTPSGDVRIVATKDSATDVVSHLFQNNYSGRAEFGLIGSDDFALKVSSDGSTFAQAFVVDHTTAKVSFDQDIAVAGGAVTLGSASLSWSTGLSLSSGAGGDAGSIALGAGALDAASSGTDNVAIGTSALAGVTSGALNVAVGDGAGAAVTTAGGNTFIGAGAGATVVGADNSALGQGAFAGAPTGITNCAAVGAGATVQGSHQVQLGNSATTTYAYGAIQDRSDERDKADVRDTALGLEFIRALRPVDFRWDYREDYSGRGPGEASADGSKKRNRFHHGFLAQEIEQVIRRTGMDFGGYQDHAIAGGRDVKTLGYTEFVAPIVRAIQQLSEDVDALRKKLPGVVSD
ncbi:DUF2793 domain-containing protein [Acuticoccus sediminis]|uniref:DUF2793 domain-containing protein n=1 Tax=Acuticoccus sediminis TaxID=2184697 RepID=UPI001CFCC9F6|nr:DUF2793 domain-containing protein [Acuticoccus sediminis]